MAILQSLPSLCRNFAARYSPWMLVGVALILAMAITVMAMRNAQREWAYMSQNLMDRRRSDLGRGSRNPRQHGHAYRSAERTSDGGETAKQAGVIYMVVTDGNRIASSTKEDVGKSYEPQVLSSLTIGEKSRWRERLCRTAGKF